MRLILLSAVSLIAALPAYAQHPTCAQDRRTIHDLEERKTRYRESGDMPALQREYDDISREIAELNFHPNPPGAFERLERDRRDVIDRMDKARSFSGFIASNEKEIARTRDHLAARGCRLDGPMAPPPPEDDGPPPPPRPHPWDKPKPAPPSGE